MRDPGARDQERGSNDPDRVELPPAGPLLSRVGFGAWQAGGHGWAARDDEAALAAIIAAIEVGFNLIDTADVYGFGRSEELVRRAVDAVPGAREEVIVATKGGVVWNDSGRTRKDSSPEQLREAVEGSLARLGTESIDLFYLHWPDGVTPVAESVAALAALRQEGKIRRIGLSNVTADEVDSVAGVGISAVQVKGNLLEPQEMFAIAGAARRAGALVVAYSSLADGLLTGRIGSDHVFASTDHRSRYPLFQGDAFAEALKRVEVLKSVAGREGRTPAQVALRWVLDSRSCDVVLVGTATAGHVHDNAGALGWSLGGEALRKLSSEVPLERLRDEGHESAQYPA